MGDERKHTAGPWEIVDPGAAPGLVEIVSVDCDADDFGRSRFISVSVCTIADTSDEEANARLIAAAPDLLDALKDLLLLCENSSFENGVTDQSGRDEGDYLAGGMTARARAALAKAQPEDGRE